MRLLALSPHTDDAEIGAGGTIARYVAEGATVRVVAFGTGDRPGGATDGEMREAMAALGDVDWALFDFTSRYYSSERGVLLHLLEKERDTFKPDLVLCPATCDLHQDHRTVTTECLRAFRYTCSIWGYEVPWNAVGEAFDGTAFVHLEQAHLDAKLGALTCYDSQNLRHYMDAEFVTALARVRGVQVMAQYAEAFEVIRQVVPLRPATIAADASKVKWVEVRPRS